MEKNIRTKLYEIIFEADTKAGKTFDVLLILTIILSIIIVILDSMPELQSSFHHTFKIIEWTITIFFTLEYILRIFLVKKPRHYIFSYFGIIDLLATLPTYLWMIFSGGSSLLVIRALRLLRVFRVLKLSRYTRAGLVLRKSLSSSKAKIGVFLAVVFTVIIIIGTLMYLIEGDKSGFTSIPRSIYWTIVTITTVGYGDIAPITGLGQFIASITMLTGFVIIAVPTGILSAEINQQHKLLKRNNNTQSCTGCLANDHDGDAVFCKQCGAKLN